MIEIEITVPEHVAWYKVGDDYYFNLKPQLDYWVDESGVNPGLYGWGYTNMIGVDPIPVRITNMNDGSDLISVDCLDENNMIYFYDYNHRDEDESRTFLGQYDGYIYNYLKYKNLTNEEFNVISIENVTNIFWRNYVSYFGKNETKFVVYPEEEFNIDISSSYYIVPEEVPDEIKIHYNMTFASSEGKYYAIGVERDCGTKIYEVPEVNVMFSLQENGKATARITNYSDYEVQDIVIYYKVYAPGTIEVLMENSIITTLQRGETVEINDIEYEPKEEGSDVYISNLRIGMLDGNTFIFRYIQYDGEEIEKIKLREHSHEIWSMDVPTSEVKRNILPLKDILNGNVEHVQASPTIESTGSPKISASHKPTSTPEPSSSPCATASSVVTVTRNKRYYVNPWVYHSIAAAVAVLVGLILYRRRKSV